MEDVRQLLTFFYPSLGKPLPEKSYAENCSVEWINLWVSLNLICRIKWTFSLLLIVLDGTLKL